MDICMTPLQAPMPQLRLDSAAAQQAVSATLPRMCALALRALLKCSRGPAPVPAIVAAPLQRRPHPTTAPHNHFPPTCTSSMMKCTSLVYSSELSFLMALPMVRICARANAAACSSRNDSTSVPEPAPAAAVSVLDSYSKHADPWWLPNVARPPKAIPHV